MALERYPARKEGIKTQIVPREDTDKLTKDHERRINMAYDRIKEALEQATKP